MGRDAIWLSTAGHDRSRNECVFIEKFPEPRGVWRLVFEVRAIEKKEGENGC